MQIHISRLLVKKKKAKSEKSLQSAKESIQFAVNAAIDLGGTIDDIPETLSKEQRNLERNVWKCRF